MLLYVIRHGDPDYKTDSLTELGKKQAEALAERLAVHGLDRVYTSPLGRARQTAEATCRRLMLDYEVEDWMSEDIAWKGFHVENPDGSRNWVFQTPNSALRIQEYLALGDDWARAPLFAKGGAFREGYTRLTIASDDFLARQGYRREGTRYRVEKPNEERIAAFCHQGFGLAWLSQLLCIQPLLFWSGFDMTHTGISVFRFQNHSNGYTVPKCLCLSDTSHIYAAGLPLLFDNSIPL